MKLIITLLAMLTTICTYGQKINTYNVPGIVKSSFTKQFPQAKSVKWEKENDTTFEASFNLHKTEYSALIDDKGTWIETEIAVAKKDLPGAILETIAKEFSGFTVEEAEVIERKDTDKLYEVQLEKGELTYEVQFTLSGSIAKKEISESDERD